jgi:hypothetical protein
MLLSQTICQQCIPYWACKRDVNNPAGMYVSDFGVAEKKFMAPEAMLMN